MNFDRLVRMSDDILGIERSYRAFRLWFFRCYYRGFMFYILGLSISCIYLTFLF